MIAPKRKADSAVHKKIKRALKEASKRDGVTIQSDDEIEKRSLKCRS